MKLKLLKILFRNNQNKKQKKYDFVLRPTKTDYSYPVKGFKTYSVPPQGDLNRKLCIIRIFGIQQNCFLRSPTPKHKKKVPDGTQKVADVEFGEPIHRDFEPC